ncbi:phosphotransferase family protein [Actinospongicola halichondriae]|uniref:phosphotransferase family protein n=1 Tax=Actinospongicola halichondriae TaxID=3236844 RepID=UPI003D43CBDE
MTIDEEGADRTIAPTLGVEQITAIVAEVEPASTVRSTADIVGGLSSWMTTVDVDRPDGSSHRLVVRRGRRPDSDRHTLPFGTEFALLRHLDRAGVPVATPRHFDDSHQIVPQDFVVLDFVAGSTRFAADDPLPLARRMGEVLAGVHAVGLTSAPSLPKHVDRMEGWILTDLSRRPPDPSLREDLIREHLEPRWPPPPSEECLLHADFFPGNVVWNDGDIAAVIDWESAAIGDPMADVATTRLDLRWVFGADASDAFTDSYLARTGRSTDTLAIWELVVSLRPAGALSLWASDMADHGRPDITADTMRAEQHAFVDSAIGRLAGN